MKRLSTFTLVLILALLLSGCFALAEREEASGTVAAPTLAPAAYPADGTNDAADAYPAAGANDAAEAYPAADANDAAEASNAADASDAADAYPAEEMAEAVTPLPEEADAASEAYPADDTGEAAAPGAATVFTIDPARSEARFTINEVLRGEPTTVVGRTSNLGGQIALDLNDPAAAQIGAIAINARDIATDNEFRNNAIANEILHSDQYELINFEPTAVSGLPDAVEIGQTYPLQITGDLTITDQTREVTFEAQVTPVSASELQGVAQLDMLYADFGLTIPFARAVESVEDTVVLELEFTAVAS